MIPDSFIICNTCGNKIHTPEHPTPGDYIQCSYCGTPYRYIKAGKDIITKEVASDGKRIDYQQD